MELTINRSKIKYMLVHRRGACNIEPPNLGADMSGNVEYFNYQRPIIRNENEVKERHQSKYNSDQQVYLFLRYVLLFKSSLYRIILRFVYMLKENLILRKEKERLRRILSKIFGQFQKIWKGNVNHPGTEGIYSGSKYSKVFLKKRIQDYLKFVKNFCG